MLDYEAELSSYRVEVPDRFNVTTAIVESWAEEDPQAPAALYIDEAGEVVKESSAADLADAGRRAARVLLDLGIAKGDHVFVMVPPSPAWHAALLGCMRIGAVPVPGPNLLTPKDIEHRLRRTRAIAAITDEAGSRKVDQTGADLRVKLGVGSGLGAAWEDFEALCVAADGTGLPDDPTGRDDPLILYFTSGTVSEPKMVQHAHSYALGHVGTARFWHDLRSGDLHWTVADTGWAKAAWGSLFGQWHERACVVLSAMKPDPERVLDLIARYRISSFCAPPTLYRSLVQVDFGGRDLSALRHCTSAGEPLNPEVIHIWRKSTGGLTVYEGYGQTETTCVVANYRTAEVRAGSMGRPVPGWEMDVVDDDGNAVEVGAVGNVVVRSLGPQVGLFPGYHEDAEATAECMRGDLYFTGDRAALDKDGYFWFEGRNDDVITSSAYRIGPFEVESALVAHPAVVEAAVIGRDDPKRTQVVVGVCVLTGDAEPSPELARELQDFVKTTTAPYKYPREIHFVADLPKTVSGKIRRGELRGWLLDGRLPKPSKP
ncbi:MAG: AMP-binding protein [Actinobacteria bacterium]|nr:AMP-binding protein [Actinomycetota bacterium]